MASSSVLDVCLSEERSTSGEDALGTGVWGSGIEGGPLRIGGLLGGFIRDRIDDELTFSEDWTDLVTGEGCRWRNGGRPFSTSAARGDS